MNGLNNSALFPYSLNNLQQITTSDGGSLPVQADVPIIKTLTTTAQEITLYESSPDLIDFEFYNKSLKVDTIFAGSGSISSLTGGLCNFNTGSFKTLNSGVLISTTGSISSLTGGQLFFNSGTFTNITAGNITISTLNIPNLSFTTATGGQLYTQNIDNSLDIQTQTLNATGTITSNTSLRTTNGSAIFDFTDISSDGTKSIYNAGGANEGFSLRFDGNERLFLRQNGELLVSNINCSGAFTGSNITCNDLTVKTGASMWNLTVNNGLNAPNANIGAFALTASGFVNAPYFTGAKVDTNFLTFTTATGTNLTCSNISFTTATGGTVRSNVVVRNPQTLQFNKTDDSQIVRIEPAGVANVLSFYDASNVLQTLYTTTSSGANVDNLNQLGTKDITNLGRIFNGDGSVSNPSYSFVNDTDSGFYRVGDNNIALSLGNSQKVNFQTNLITFGSTSNNSVGGAINGDLQIGRTSFSNTSLINFGFTGSVYGVNPSRAGFITNDATNMTIANTQATTGSNSVGSIFITPASSSNTWIKRPNGQMINNARGFANDYTSFLVNFNTGAFGLVLQNPNQEAYLFSTQTFGNHSAHTMHGAVSNVMSNLTIGRTNYPFSAEEALTLRPWSNTGSRTTEIKIANTTDEAFGYTIFGMSPTGHTSGGKLVSNFGFVSNSNNLGGFYICTNTNTTVPNTYPRYFVDASGNHEFSLSSITGAFSITSSPYSVGIGTSFSSTRGQGRYVPLSVASLTNTTYTGGTEFLVRGSSSSNNDHSAFTTNQIYRDWETDRKSTRLNSSHSAKSRMPSSA